MAEKLKIEYISVDKIKPYEKNARKHQDADIQTIVNSIKEFGFDDPIGVWGEENLIVEGHGRLLAAKKLGMETVPVIHLDHLTGEQRRAYALAHNKTAEMSEWDFDILGGELDDIFEIDMSQFGFELADNEEPREIVEDEMPEEVETRCKLGDVWKLGNHRLICGDSTDVAVIDRLMDGAKVDMVFTDPPYNVAMSRSKVDGSNNSIMNDDLDDDDFIELLQGAFSNAIMNCKTNNMYWWIGFRAYSTLEKIFHDAGIKISNCIVWNKGSIGLGGKGFRYQHELCIFSGEINNNSASDVWEFPRSTEGLHPTMKPIALVAYAIKNINDVKSVLDLFGGSGSTLIACEQLHRRCFMCELDPHYCSVILQRHINFKGSDVDVFLLKDGKKIPYSEVHS